MKAQAWRLYVCDSSLDAAHGMFYPIVEIYVPDLRLVMNQRHYFVCSLDHERYATKKEGVVPFYTKVPDPEIVSEFEISDELVEKLKALKLAFEQTNDIRQSLYAIADPLIKTWEAEHPLPQYDLDEGEEIIVDEDNISEDFDEDDLILLDGIVLPNDDDVTFEK